MPAPLLPILVTLLILIGPARAHGAQALVAVAANFAPTAAELKEDFETQSPHTVLLAAGSTGKLYAQITKGAPFDVLLAADQARPERLEADGAGVAGTRFTYAVGQLGIWLPGSKAPDEQLVRARLADSRRVAVANPALAPYGAAAMTVLRRLELEAELGARLATGENVAQAYAMVASGSAEAGLVAWAHLLSRNAQAEAWQVPADWHAPIRQDALLLRHGAENPAARAFLDFLGSDAARALITHRGYAPGP